MKKLIVLYSAIAFVSCDSSSTIEEGGSVSTVDSNLAASAGPNPGLQNLDNPYSDSSFTIALDSAGPTVNPQDTNYSKK